MTEFKIRIEPTEHPELVKFKANRFLLKRNGKEFDHIEETTPSPLAHKLFQLSYIDKVYIAQNFVAIQKHSNGNWEDLQDKIVQIMKEHLSTGRPAIIEDQNKKIPITLYIETAKDPDAIEFVASTKLAIEDRVFHKIEEADDSALAQQLFLFPFVKVVSFKNNRISVTKDRSINWGVINARLREFIRQHLINGKPVLNDESVLNQNQPNSGKARLDSENREEVSEKLTKTIEKNIRPALMNYGRTIELEAYHPENQSVYLVLRDDPQAHPTTNPNLKDRIAKILREKMNGKIGQISFKFN